MREGDGDSSHASEDGGWDGGGDGWVDRDGARPLDFLNMFIDLCE